MNATRPTSGTETDGKVPDSCGPFDEDAVRKCYELYYCPEWGVLETRFIPAGGGAPLIGFFDNPEDFVRCCREHDGSSQLYMGVRPRDPGLLSRSRNSVRFLPKGVHAGQQGDVGVVATAVIDIDPTRPKDTASTQEQLALAREVAERIQNDFVEMGWPAPIRAMSGNGVHVIFAFTPVHITDQAHRDAVEGQLKAFEAGIRTKYTVEGIKIDTISDLPRIIKVVGTLSTKGDNTPERPWRRSYFIDEPVRIENPLFWDFVATLPAADEKKKAKATAGNGTNKTDIVIGDAISPKVQKAIQSKNRKAHWEGRCKTALGADGTPVDTSRSGYDYTVVIDLLHAGITNPSELATALFHRPNGAGKEKGANYVCRTVEAAIAAFKSEDDEDHGGSHCSVEPVHATMTSSNPKLFELVFSEGVLEISADELSNQHKFETAYLNAIGAMPIIKITKRTPWAAYVNSWLTGALIKELPPEASTAFRLKEMIYKIVMNLAEGHDVGDLDAGAYLLLDGRRAFKPAAVVKAIQNMSGAPRVSSHDVCNVLEKLGCKAENPYFGKKRVRVHIVPEQWPGEVSGVERPCGDPCQLSFTFFMEPAEQETARA